MTQPKAQIADLIGSRICHDLISPLGAISNGLELLSMTPGMTGPEMELISDSVENANARIRFFRIAFGAASEGQKTSRKEIDTILTALTANSRFAVEWAPSDDIERPLVKLAFLLIQCFETAMAWGGHVKVSALGTQWAIHGTADRMNVDPDLWHRLSRPTDLTDLPPSAVQFALAPACAEEWDRNLIVESGKNSIRVRF